MPAPLLLPSRAEGAREYRETLGLDISERPPADQPEGIPVQVAGESCIPGIDADNVAAIFEEHVVVGSLDPFNPGNNEFATRERIFSFGAVLAALGGTLEVRAVDKEVERLQEFYGIHVECTSAGCCEQAE